MDAQHIGAVIDAELVDTPELPAGCSADTDTDAAQRAAQRRLKAAAARRRAAAKATAELDVVRSDIRRADAQATVLLAIAAGALAGTLALAQHPAGTTTAVLLWAGAAPITAALVLLLTALRPRLGIGRTGFARWAQFRHEPTALISDLAFLTDDADHDAHDLVALAATALSQYRRIRSAVDCLLVALAPLVLAAVLA